MIRCPIRGHDHDLTLHRIVVQQGTGSKAEIWECPTGRYRWFLIGGQEFAAHAVKMLRPRFGWRHT